MKLKIFFPFLVLLLIAIACQTIKSEQGSVFESKELPMHEFILSTDRDTTIKLASGLQFDIPANSIQLKAGTTAHLKIQEALELRDIMKAGLTTLSDGKLLGSAGMFSFDVEEQGAEITKPIAVSLPTQRLDPAMQLFEGQPDESGQLNWMNPQALAVAPPSGAELFASQCASCHDISRERLDQQKIPLSYPLKQYTPEWLLGYLRRQEGGRAACCAKSRWEPSPESLIGDVLEDGSFTDQDIYNDDYETADTTPKLEQWVPDEETCPHKAIGLNDDQLLSVIDYIEAESERKVLPLPRHNAVLCEASCEELQHEYEELEQQQRRLRKAKRAMLSKESELKAEKYNFDVKREPVAVRPGAMIIPDTTIFEFSARYVPNPPAKEKLSAYKFTIKSPGWYNIDKFLKKGKFDDVQLLVEILGEYEKNVDLFVVVPSEKVLAKAGQSANNDYYSFTEDGILSMPIGKLAWIYVQGEQNGTFVFASMGFRLARENTLRIQPEKSTPEAMENALQLMSQDLTLLVEENEHYELDKELFTLEADLDKIDEQQLLVTQEQEKIIRLMDKPENCACACEGLARLRGNYDS